MAVSEIRAVMWPEDGRWHGRLDQARATTHTSRSRAACLDRLRREAGKATLTVEVVPPLVGMTEAAEILGWDRRRVFTYVARGAFPESVAALSSGRVWRREDVEAFAKSKKRKKRSRTA